VTEDKTTGNVELGFSNRSTAYGHPAIQIGPPRQAHWLCQSGKACRGARLRFDLAEQKSQTLLRFTHADWQAETDDFAACATTSSERPKEKRRGHHFPGRDGPTERAQPGAESSE
jgi:hypothetical protein